MIFTIGTRNTRPIKNLVYYTSKINQRIRFTSEIATRYPDHHMIYKFPLVRVASLVNRLKFYQTVATGIGIPTTAILAALDIIATETAVTFATSGIGWCLGLCAVGFLGHNRVGFIYLNNDETSVRISYADFWGRRVDTDVEVTDIWPLNDLPTSAINPLYYSLRRYSTKQTLKFNVKYGEIIDSEKFRRILGDPFLNVKP